MKFLERIFHRHQWRIIDQTPIDKVRYHCVLECEKCKKRKAEIIDVNHCD